MKGYAYILRCSNGNYYAGSTNNLERRLTEHQDGKGANFTRKYLPVELIYWEEFQRIDEAFYREKQIQGWSREKKEALIAGNKNKLQDLAVCRNASSCINYRNRKEDSFNEAEMSEMKTGASTTLSVRENGTDLGSQDDGPGIERSRNAQISPEKRRFNE